MQPGVDGQHGGARLCVLLHPRAAGSTPLSVEFYHAYPVVSALDSKGVLEQLRTAGYTHCLLLRPGTSAWRETIDSFEKAIAQDEEHLLVGVYAGDVAPRRTRWGVRFATGFKLKEPDAHQRVYPLLQMADLSLPDLRETFARDSLLPLSRAGVQAVEVPLPGSRPAEQSVVRPAFSFRRLQRGIYATFVPLFLPPAFLELTGRRSFRALPFRQQVREGLQELLLREPGSNARIGGSAGFGFFMALIPLWGYQILLTVLLSQRLGFSKTVALLCAQISLPPLIPFIMYGSLLFGRVILGLEEKPEVGALELAPEDFWPWFLGSWVLAASVGLVGGLLVWILASLLRRSGEGTVQSSP